MKILVILALWLVPLSAQGQNWTSARELADDCAAGNTPLEGDAETLAPFAKSISCVSYIRGAVDTWMAAAWALAAATKGETQVLLPTADYTNSELKDAFMAYLKEHPERGPSSPSLVIRDAIIAHHMVHLEAAPKTEKKPK